MNASTRLRKIAAALAMIVVAVSGLVASSPATATVSATINYDCNNPLRGGDYYALPGDVSVQTTNCDHLEINGTPSGTSITIPQNQWNPGPVVIDFIDTNQTQVGYSGITLRLADPNISAIPNLELARTVPVAIPDTSPANFEVLGTSGSTADLNNDPDCELEVGFHAYQQATLQVTETGDVTVRVAGTSPDTDRNSVTLSNVSGTDPSTYPISDTFVALYSTFNPANPNSNVIGCNDDGYNQPGYLSDGTVVSDVWSEFDAGTLQPGNYTIVLTTYGQYTDTQTSPSSFDGTSWSMGSNGAPQTADIQIWSDPGIISPVSLTVDGYSPSITPNYTSYTVLPAAYSDGSGTYVYVADSDNSAIYIYDVTDPLNISTPTSWTGVEYPTDIKIWGGYAYVAGRVFINGVPVPKVFVLDLSNPTAPTVPNSFPVTDSLLPTGESIQPRKLAIQGSNLFVAGSVLDNTYAPISANLVVFDLDSSTTQPPQMSNPLALGWGSLPWGADEVGGLDIAGASVVLRSAYGTHLTTINADNPGSLSIQDDETGANNASGPSLSADGAWIFEASDTSGQTQASVKAFSYTDPTQSFTLTLPVGFQAAQQTLVGNYLLVGDYDRGLVYAVDVSDPTNMSFSAQTPFPGTPGGLPTPYYSPIGMTADTHNAYVVSHDGNNNGEFGLSVINLSSLVQYTASFDAQCVNVTEPDMSFNSGGSIALPAAPNCSGFTFDGWFTAASGGTPLSAPYTPGTNANITLYAQWTAVAPASYTVTYDSAGGSAIPDGTYTAGGSVTLPAAPTKSGFTFDGWFTSATGGTALSSPYTPSTNANITLHAQWTGVAPSPTPTPTPAPTPTDDRELGFTGFKPWNTLALGGLLLGAGLSIWVTRRRTVDDRQL